MTPAAFLGRPRVPFEKLTDGDSSSSLTICTFSDLDLGPEHPDRKVFAAIAVRAAGTPSISSVTIGGTAMSSMVAAVNTVGGNRTHAAIFACAKPTGTTGDLVITMSGSGGVRFGFTLYRATAADLTALSAKTSLSDTPSETVDIPARGFAIACGYAGNNTVTGAAWTGLTEDTERLISAAGYSSASLRTHDAVSTLGVTLTWTGINASFSAFAMAAFGY